MNDKEENPFTATGMAHNADPEENPFEHRLNPTDLQKREQQLLKREAEVASRERALQEGRPVPGGKYILKHANNWPCRCLPLLYHDINEEIPSAYRSVVRKFYFLVFFDWICLLWNFIATFAFYLTDEPLASSGTASLFAVVYLAFGVIGSWNFWYRQLYEGIRDGSSRKWLCHFCNFSLHILWSILMVVGVPATSMVGVLWLMKLTGNKMWALMAFINIVIWGLQIGLSIIFLKSSHRAWSNAGGQQKLQAEAGAVAMKTVKENPQLVKQALTAV